jgi:hypothetical protein
MTEGTMSDATTPANDWFEDYAENEEEEGDGQIEEYDLTATPNDFNVLTINNFIQSGAVKIPGFQRNYVWDRVRASKLIESLILGLPVPQVFLYERSRNEFLVIDGQQRLMTLYYFIKQRFPRNEKRAELRLIFDEHGGIPEEVLHDDTYFSPFKLWLPGKLPNQPNKLHGTNYATLGAHRSQFDLRPVRNIIVKQNSPSEDDSSVYEIFNRLNSGGINLRPQEIRSSLYHSKFYEMLQRANGNARWRALIGRAEPDLHMKDVEILLRSFAMLISGASYTPSMTRFLNQFSKYSQSNRAEQNSYLEQLFQSFITSTEHLPPDVFVSVRSRRLNVALIEAVFAAACQAALAQRALVAGHLRIDQIRALDNDVDFIAASQKATTQTNNVKKRLERAAELVQPVV